MNKDLSHYKRILIVGDAGRGKSTLAKKLSERLNIPWYATDDFHWKEKFTTLADRDESIEKIQKIYELDEWILEGPTVRLVKEGFERAEIIYYLRFTNIFSQWFMLLKRHGGRKNESIPQLLHLLRHVFYKRFRVGYKKHDETLDEAIQPFHSKVLVLTSFKEIDAL